MTALHRRPGTAPPAPPRVPAAVPVCPLRARAAATAPRATSPVTAAAALRDWVDSVDWSADFTRAVATASTSPESPARWFDS